MKAALLGLLLSSSVGFSMEVAPLNKSEVPTDTQSLLEKAYFQCNGSYCTANVCQTPYNACFVGGMWLLGTQCNCNGIIGQIAAE